ncbi:hypothetical protein [Sporosarcina newyorkensis]|uniref:hypothetical protein n=1 Tax=Sporosarcina newyorkensis TaxID=759851 RepID=UPI003D088F92
MPKYTVLKDFTDLQDSNHIYRAGDEYPRKGKATKKRVEELSTKNNKRKEIFIQEVDENDEG